MEGCSATCCGAPGMRPVPVLSGSSLIRVRQTSRLMTRRYGAASALAASGSMGPESVFCNGVNDRMNYTALHEHTLSKRPRLLPSGHTSNATCPQHSVGAGHVPIPCAPSWMPFSTSCALAVPGGTCRAISHPGRRSSIIFGGCASGGRSPSSFRQ